jgi:hypothetical protein
MESSPVDVVMTTARALFATMRETSNEEQTQRRGPAASQLNINL